tara:strand:+ start:77 stop:262 length:186 start_codon:yes stop_codon:yes gene_type:complete
LFSTWKYIYYQNIDTSLPETFWEGAVADFGNELRSIGCFRVFWKNNEEAFAELLKVMHLRD